MINSLLLLNLNDYDVLLEPSAGTGSFFNLMDPFKRLGIDLDPKCDNIVTGDFLTFTPDTSLTYVTIGNPPFGRVSSLAVKFFNKPASFSNVVAFIVPRTFKKVSIQNRLDLNFHLKYTEDLPERPCCFEPAMSAKCCFQVWIRGNARSRVTLSTTHDDFTFVYPEQADFVMRNTGSNIGEIVDDRDRMHSTVVRSHHWIKSNIGKDELMRRFKLLDYSSSKDTVRQDSLGKAELIYLYSEKFDIVAPRVPIVMKTTTDDFIFSTYDDCDIVIRRVGVNAGQIMDKSDLKEGFGSESCYWIKSKIDITQLRKKFESLDFTSCVNDTANKKSLGKGELIQLYESNKE